MTPRALPLHCICQNPACGCVFAVATRRQQRTRKYHTRACADVMTAPVTRTRMLAQRAACVARGRVGGQKAARTTRARLIARVRRLSPLEAYKKGRVEGWHAGVRSVRRRLALGAGA